MFDELVRVQDGVVTRAQALACGLTRAQIARRLRSGRWRRIFPGVYATFSGPVPRPSMLWAALLRAGPGAVLSHDSAAELAGLAPSASAAIHITVPANQSPARVSGVVIHRSRSVMRRRHPSRVPPQTRIEDTVVDLTQSCRSLDDAVSWLARAVGSRLTTADRLAATIQARARVRSRPVLLAALADIATGSHSLAELIYLRAVERAHGLPRSHRQARREGAGPSRYDDVRYRRYGTRVEVDGRAAHPDHQRWRDMRRDNAAVLAGDRVLRYGLAELQTAPCVVAAQVAQVLRAAGWTGAPHRCERDGCAIS